MTGAVLWGPEPYQEHGLQQRPGTCVLADLFSCKSLGLCRVCGHGLSPPPNEMIMWGATCAGDDEGVVGVGSRIHRALLCSCTWVPIHHVCSWVHGPCLGHVTGERFLNTGDDDMSFWYSIQLEGLPMIYFLRTTPLSQLILSFSL